MIVVVEDEGRLTNADTVDDVSATAAATMMAKSRLMVLIISTKLILCFVPLNVSSPFYSVFQMVSVNELSHIQEPKHSIF